MSILEGINHPGDIKHLSDAQMNALSGEIRDFLIQTVSRTGGHIASNLGAVELTLALHRVFDSPQDKIIFDVGHQCYTHKILTGRREAMHTLRAYGGISGFPKPYESKHDPFCTGHASTSISLALGFAQAEKLRDGGHYGVAVIGDGALTGGMAYEAMVNAGRSETNTIIVLNDNGMSISKNVGSIDRGLTKIRTSRRYFKAKDRVHGFFRKIPLVGKGLDRLVSGLVRRIKGFIYNTTLFDDLNLVYLGPVDGHNMHALTVLLERAKQLKRPCLVHAVTVKGKGFEAAEHDPVSYHGAPVFNAVTGQFKKNGSRDFAAAFGDCITEFAVEDERICVITAAMTDGCGLHRFAETFPGRLFDVGIAEAHAATFAAGLAAGGFLPVFAVYSTFLQRSADQLIHDVALSGKKVVFAIDRAGLVGADGETHQGLYDISILRAAGIPILCPANFLELQTAFRRALYDIPGPVAVRYPRGTEDPALRDWMTMQDDYAVLRGSEKEELALISHGTQVTELLSAAGQISELDPMIVKLNCLHPFPEELAGLLRGYRHIVYAAQEAKAVSTGHVLAGAVSGGRSRVHILGPAGFVEHGEPGQLLEKLGLDAAGIAGYCKRECADG